MTIALSADHAGVDLKDALAAWLKEDGHDVLDLGTHGHDSVDYPDFGAGLGRAIAEGKADRGIAVCGSGIGISIAVNRNPACRCALVNEPLSAQLARQHNDANVLAIVTTMNQRQMAAADAELSTWHVDTVRAFAASMYREQLAGSRRCIRSCSRYRRRRESARR